MGGAARRGESACMHRTGPAPTDEQLVVRVRAGDDAAYETIVIRYRERLLGFAARLAGGSHADAEDIVQDALIRALPALRTGDRPMALRPWLYMIVRNRAFDLHRAGRGRQTDDDARLMLVPAPGPADPADRAVAREELDRVVAEIGRLPDRQRVALVRRELGGATHRELAAELSTTVAGTKSLLVRARTTLTEAVAA
jgi:RNA polymerase sigma factor (sigma-70 family)